MIFKIVPEKYREELLFITSQLDNEQLQKKPAANIILRGKRLNVLYLRLEPRQGC